MLGPDDVDNLMNNEGLPTDEIEKLRIFFNAEIKDKGLKTVLTTIEKAIADYDSSEVVDVSEVRTPRQGSNVEGSQDIAQENYLRATNKMQVNATNNSISHAVGDRPTYHQHKESREAPQRLFSKAASMSPEITVRTARPDLK